MIRFACRLLAALREAWDAFEFVWTHHDKLRRDPEWMTHVEPPVDLRQYDDGSYGDPHNR